MSKKKKNTKPAAKARELEFRGGPRDRDKIRMAWPPPIYVRLAIPEWATYKFNGVFYDYIGNVPVNTDDHTFGHRPTWKVPDGGN